MLGSQRREGWEVPTLSPALPYRCLPLGAIGAVGGRGENSWRVSVDLLQDLHLLLVALGVPDTREGPGVDGIDLAC